MKISVIMPAYNAEKHIERAIKSVLDQTFQDWELVIGEDCSTDNTVQIIKSFRDPRITIFHTDKNSGSVYVPRNLAFNHAHGEFVLALDSDDYIENDYLETLYNRIISCDADTCLGKIIFVDENGTPIINRHSIPNSSFDFNSILTGDEAFLYTVPEWRISMNGCLCKYQIWKDAWAITYKEGKRGIHDDENTSRFLLIYSNRVVFSQAIHYYTINSTSVTHVFNKRIFDWQIAERDLASLVKAHYGADSIFMNKVRINSALAFRYALGTLIDSYNTIEPSSRSWYLYKFKIWHNEINWNSVTYYTNLYHRLILPHFYFYIILYAIKHFSFVLIKDIFITLLKLTKSYIQSNNMYHWYILRRQREHSITKMLMNSYKSEDSVVHQPYVINIYQGEIKSGGLADRLRGIIGTYMLCSELHRDYKLCFKYPFDLDLFLVPNTYDWRVDNNEISKNRKSCCFIVLDSTQDNNYQFKKQRQFIEKRIKKETKQIHIYTNAGFAYNSDYSKAFNELFKPSDRLKASVSKHLSAIGAPFISVSLRFLDLLNDFNETCKTGIELSEEERNELINESIHQIYQIRNRFKMKLLINSDSISFLKRVSEIEFIYVVPGNITHIDSRDCDTNYEYYEKTFIDFFLISKAERIILLKSQKMHKSGFPYAASLIEGKPFEIIEY